MRGDVDRPPELRISPRNAYEYVTRRDVPPPTRREVSPPDTTGSFTPRFRHVRIASFFWFAPALRRSSHAARHSDRDPNGHRPPSSQRPRLASDRRRTPPLAPHRSRPLARLPRPPRTRTYSSIPYVRKIHCKDFQSSSQHGMSTETRPPDLGRGPDPPGTAPGRRVPTRPLGARAPTRLPAGRSQPAATAASAEGPLGPRARPPRGLAGRCGREGQTRDRGGSQLVDRHRRVHRGTACQ